MTKIIPEVFDRLSRKYSTDTLLTLPGDARHRVLTAIVVRQRFKSRLDKIPGTEVTIEELEASGLLRWDEDPRHPDRDTPINCPYIVLRLLAAKEGMYDDAFKLVTDLQEYDKKHRNAAGGRKQLDWQYFEDVVVFFRHLKSILLNGRATTIADLHLGARFSPKSRLPEMKVEEKERTQIQSTNWNPTKSSLMKDPASFKDIHHGDGKVLT